MEPLFVIRKYTHYFQITQISLRAHAILSRFLLKYVLKSFRPPNPYGPPKDVKDKVFAVVTSGQDEYRFHVGQLEPLLELIQSQGFDPSAYCPIEEIPLHTPVALKTRMRPGWALRDKQPEVVQFLLADMPGDFHSRLVTLPTGSGKGICSLWAICERGYRTIYIILPKYIEKTVIEIKEKTDAQDKDIMVVQGGDALRGLIELAKEGTYKNDFVIISMNTWVLFLESYLNDRKYCVEDEYGCAPEQLFPMLGVGTKVIDEIHQHLHMVYRSFCFTNVDRAIGMSATFLSNDQFVDFMQRVMFPREIRFEAVAMKKYIRAYGISYNIGWDSMKHIKTTERGSSSYSQGAFETSIIKNKKLLASYLDLVVEVVEEGFLDEYQEGHKCIIFVRLIEMCELIVEHLRKKFPEYDIRKYSQGDPYENLQDPDIRVTTYQSSGTAHDIPGLMTNITMDNLNSPVATLQCLGRLREPKIGNPRYLAVYSESIPKHVAYHRDRKALIADRVLSFKDFRSKICL